VATSIGIDDTYEIIVAHRKRRAELNDGHSSDWTLEQPQAWVEQPQAWKEEIDIQGEDVRSRVRRRSCACSGDM
jgi:hypothetical protein